MTKSELIAKIASKYPTLYLSDIEKIEKKVKSIITECEEFAESSPFPEITFDVI